MKEQNLGKIHSRLSMDQAQYYIQRLFQIDDATTVVHIAGTHVAKLINIRNGKMIVPGGLKPEDIKDSMIASAVRIYGIFLCAFDENARQQIQNNIYQASGVNIVIDEYEEGKEPKEEEPKPSPYTYQCECEKCKAVGLNKTPKQDMGLH